MSQLTSTSSLPTPQISSNKKHKNAESNHNLNCLEPKIDHFSSAPSEIAFTIFSYLSGQELLQVSLVSKLFHSISSDNSLWKKMKIDGLPSSIVIKNKRDWVTLTQVCSTDLPNSEFNHFFSKVITSGLFSKNSWKKDLKKILSEYEQDFQQRPLPKINSPYAFSKAQILSFIFTISEGWPLKAMEILTYKEWKFLKGHEGTIAKMFMINIAQHSRPLDRLKKNFEDTLAKVSSMPDRLICFKLLCLNFKDPTSGIKEKFAGDWKLSHSEDQLFKIGSETIGGVSSENYSAIFPDHLTRMILARSYGRIPHGDIFSIKSLHLASRQLHLSIRKEFRLFLLGPVISSLTEKTNRLSQIFNRIKVTLSLSVKEIIDENILSEGIRKNIYHHEIEDFFDFQARFPWAFKSIENAEEQRTSFINRFIADIKEFFAAEPSLTLVIFIFKNVIAKNPELLLRAIKEHSIDDPTFTLKILKHIAQEDPTFLKKFIDLVRMDFKQDVEKFEEVRVN